MKNLFSFLQRSKKPSLCLPSPKTYKEEILLSLIRKGEVSLLDFPFLASFRSNVSELKLQHELPLERVKVEFVSKYGNKSFYIKHILFPDYQHLAIETYKSLNNNH